MTITSLNRMGIYPETAESILGKGLKFPFAFLSSRGRPVTSTAGSAEAEHVNDAIWQILGTRIGERFMRRDFGSRLHELIFEPLDQVFRSLAKIYTKEAISRWEKRVVVRDITFSDDDYYISRGIQPGTIFYTLIKTQAPGNLVYPYSRTPEGETLAKTFSAGEL